MKLALINILDIAENIPPMGLVYIATYLKEYIGFENTKIIDANVEDILTNLKKYDPSLIGISSMTFTYDKAIELAKTIKKNSKLSTVPIIIGGVHISTLPTSLGKNFDIGVIGEGEQTMLELIQLYEKYETFPINKLFEINGIIYHNKDGLISTKRRDLIKPLDRIPIPDRSFLHSSYFKKHTISFINNTGIEAHMLTSRGCPYRCVFCSTAAFWHQVREHSIEHIYNEVKQLVGKYNVDSIIIWDDLFIYNKKKLGKLAEMFEKEKLTENVKFSCQLRANLVDDQLCDILKRINVKTVSLGFDSGSSRTLNYLKKGSVTVEQNKNAINICKEHGFKLIGSLMLGSPGETLEDMKKTIDFIDYMKNKGVDLT